jgi:hypothetical protein
MRETRLSHRSPDRTCCLRQKLTPIHCFAYVLRP